MEYQDLVYEQEDGVAVVRLNRPERLNAIGPRLVHELLHVVETTERDDAVKVLLLTGTGRGFCAGADLAATAQEREDDKDYDEQDGYRRMIQGPIGHWGVLYSALNHYPKPMIAAVNGVSAGAGLSLALAADIRVASTEARFIAVFIRRGIVPDTGSTFHLPQLIGRGRAIEMMLTGDEVDAERAHQWGLVNHLVEPHELMDRSMDLARRIAAGPTIAIEITKRIVNDVTRDGIDRQLQNESWAGTRVALSEDFGEGRTAFLEGRKPVWRGR